MQQIVLSVPHTGTQTLCKVLKCDTHQHFHLKTLPVPLADVVHIPIRNPMEVAISWANRHTFQQERSKDELLQCYYQMFDYIERAKRAEALQDTQLHKIEDYDVREGHVEPQGHPDILEFQAYIRQFVVQPHSAFFKDFGYAL